MRRIDIRSSHNANKINLEVPKLGSIYVVDFYEGTEYFGTKKFRNKTDNYIDIVRQKWENGELSPTDIPKLKD